MEPVKNTIQWASIPLMIPFMLNTYYFPRDRLASILFEIPVQATQKFDGTNVGKDENGIMYGRTLQIPETTGNYQKTPLDGVRAIDAALVKTAICEKSGLDASLIGCFCLYGELMCNKSLYNYATDNLANTHQLFGAMIRPANGDAQALLEILTRLENAGFAVMRRGNEDGEEESAAGGQGDATNAEQADGGAKTTDFAMLFMNRALMTLLQASEATAKYPTVPMVGRYACLSDLIGANFDWMVNGRGEGLILVFPAPTDDGLPVSASFSPKISGLQVAKWKIGSEASANNVSLLQGIISEVETALSGGENPFGSSMKLEQALATFKQMLEVANSKKVNGQDPQPPKQKAAPVAKPTATALSDEQRHAYEEALKSAQSKFDHQDTYFEKNMKGAETYAALLAKEMLSDIKVDQEGSLTLQAHNTQVLTMVKELFVAFKRSMTKK